MELLLAMVAAPLKVKLLLVLLLLLLPKALVEMLTLPLSTTGLANVRVCESTNSVPPERVTGPDPRGVIALLLVAEPTIKLPDSRVVPPEVGAGASKCHAAFRFHGVDDGIAGLRNGQAARRSRGVAQCAGKDDVRGAVLNDRGIAGQGAIAAQRQVVWR